MVVIRYIVMMAAVMIMFGLVGIPGFASKLGLRSPDFTSDFIGLPGASVPKVILPPDPAEGEAGKQIQRADGAVRAIGPVAATPSGAPVFIDQVLSGYEPDRPDGSRFQFVVAGQKGADQRSCATPSYEGAVINHVYGYDSQIESPLFSVTIKEFAAAMDAFVTAYRTSDRGYAAKSPRNSRHKLIHVAVPSQERAVHLILSNNGKRLMWSLQLAPGARLAGVTVLGGLGNSVAHVPADVPVHFLDRGTMRRCAIVPSYPGTTSSPAAAISQAIGVDGDTWLDPEETDISKQERALRAYNNWFLARFGVSREQGRSGYLLADVAVSGPMNAGELIAYKPLGGARVVIPAAGLTFGGGLGAWPQAYQKKVVETLTQFAGGDLKNLNLNLGH